MAIAYTSTTISMPLDDIERHRVAYTTIGDSKSEYYRRLIAAGEVALEGGGLDPGELTEALRIGLRILRERKS